MEPGTEDRAAEQTVLVRIRPVYALCNVHYLMLDPLSNRLGNDDSMRFVNVAGGASGKGAVNRSRRRRGAMFVTRSVLEDEPGGNHS